MMYKVTFKGLNPIGVFAECEKEAKREAKEVFYAWGIVAKGNPKIEELKEVL